MRPASDYGFMTTSPEADSTHNSLAGVPAMCPPLNLSPVRRAADTVPGMKVDNGIGSGCLPLGGLMGHLIKKEVDKARKASRQMESTCLELEGELSSAVRCYWVESLAAGGRAVEAWPWAAPDAFGVRKTRVECN